jgi:hypothetical protein
MLSSRHSSLGLMILQRLTSLSKGRSDLVETAAWVTPSVVTGSLHWNAGFQARRGSQTAQQQRAVVTDCTVGVAFILGDIGRPSCRFA